MTLRAMVPLRFPKYPLQASTVHFGRINPLSWCHKIDSFSAVVGETSHAIRASANSSVNTSSTDDAASTIESIWNFYCMALTDPTTSKDLTDLIVMDSGSSSDLFCKLEWLLKVEQSKTPASLETNAGKITVDKAGTLPDYGKVMYSPKAMTNILSLAMASDKYRITMDTAIDNAFLVHTPQGIRCFARDANNLYSY